MKKIFSILALSMVIGLFSSCIIVTHEEPVPTYTITFRNELSDVVQNHVHINDVFDWYAKNKKDKNFVVSDSATLVQADGGTSRLRDIPRDYYQVIFTFDDTTDSYSDDTYYISDEFYLDEDKDFVLRESTHRVRVTITNRSAGDTLEESEVEQRKFEIVDSEGNVFPLKKVE